MGREELKVRSIGHCAMLEEDAIRIGTEADVSGHLLEKSGKENSTACVIEPRNDLEHHTNRKMEEDGLA